MRPGMSFLQYVCKINIAQSILCFHVFEQLVVCTPGPVEQLMPCLYCTIVRTGFGEGDKEVEQGWLDQPNHAIQEYKFSSFQTRGSKRPELIPFCSVSCSIKSSPFIHEQQWVSMEVTNQRFDFCIKRFSSWRLPSSVVIAYRVCSG